LILNKKQKQLLPESNIWCSVEHNPGKWSVPGMETTDGLHEYLHTCILR